MKFFLLLYLYGALLYADISKGMPVHGFLDVNLGYDNQTKDTEAYLGSFEFFLTKQISPHVRTLVELIFEQDDGTLVTDLERAEITYDTNELLSTTVGRFHLPFGFWNTGFHHGVQLQTSILRPRFISFEDEGGVLPSHAQGFRFNGSRENFSYAAYATNASVISVSEESNSSGVLSLYDSELSRNHNTPKLGVNLSYAVDDTRFGLHALSQKVLIYNDTASQFFMYGGYISTDSDSFEFIAELYLFNNTNLLGASNGTQHQSLATFAQIAYLGDTYSPYVRLEYSDFAADDYYFLSQRETTGDSYSRLAVGVKMDIENYSALKFAAVYTKENGLVDDLKILSQFAIYY